MALSAFIDWLRLGHGGPDHGPMPLDEPEDVLFSAEPLRILISPLSGDADNRAARHIHDRLAGQLGITVRISERPLTAPGADNSQPVFCPWRSISAGGGSRVKTPTC